MYTGIWSKFNINNDLCPYMCAHVGIYVCKIEAISFGMLNELSTWLSVYT